MKARNRFAPKLRYKVRIFVSPCKAPIRQLLLLIYKRAKTGLAHRYFAAHPFFLSTLVAWRLTMESNGVTVTRKTKHTTETRNPISQSRTVLITRTAPGSPNLIGSSIKAESHRSSFIAPSSGRNLVNTGVSKFLEGRDKEKKDMQELNQRFGNYIEKVSNRILFSRKNTVKTIKAIQYYQQLEIS